jgi:ubiquinone/menaquinone biosynthesis C-methylase UbiE
MDCDPPPGVPGPNPVRAHYARPGLARTILEAAVLPAGNASGLDVKTLAPVDEFHVRGRDATLELARAVALTPSDRVLDVGCGLGGASRCLVSAFGCQVVGIDLTADYVKTAGHLAAHFGLNHRVRYECADALALPFREAEFDVVWTQHAAMNIADKAGLYAEMYRVLKPGGRLALYDILAGEGGEVHFPSPWAREPSISFLIKPNVLNRLLIDMGFRISSWRDTTELGRAWFHQMLQRIRESGPPPLGFHLLMGDDFRAMASNQLRNLEENRIALIEVVARKSV